MQVQYYFTGVKCTPTDTAPYFVCSGCLDGFTGNGKVCYDIDEVSTTKFNCSGSVT